MFVIRQGENHHPLEPLAQNQHFLVTDLKCVDAQLIPAPGQVITDTFIVYLKIGGEYQEISVISPIIDFVPIGRPMRDSIQGRGLSPGGSTDMESASETYPISVLLIPKPNALSLPGSRASTALSHRLVAAPAPVEEPLAEVTTVIQPPKMHLKIKLPDQLPDQRLPKIGINGRTMTVRLDDSVRTYEIPRGIHLELLEAKIEHQHLIICNNDSATSIFEMTPKRSSGV